ncbi:MULTISPECIES: PEP-CTERM/exosortase system-associated acyltransferase [unclassified Pseudovibrio]|uniref:PEP-CTERM/exosortase system-associated acyltransferase n=1 Tax=unclassified Pseudovibrio TaxID=2627060 RepID=UPI0007AE5EF3|nr:MULTISPECIES: PEP-CTERM/exosortase system-associated acyltransferase [unclassified Pseudovibrio]KZK99891.1 hypothetical protein PsW74_02502 [Pseudovibrio sp. W74]KZL11721.1 hypothetical protein PsAD14_00632 [Pseudovibrio sp. Ad14]
MLRLKSLEKLSLAELKTREEVVSSFKLRFQIFCEETGFLPKENYPNGYERDRYDDTSIHIGCYFHPSPTERILAGSVRVVDTPSGQTPMLDHCIIDEKFKDLFGGREDVVELSRMCVRSSFRRRYTGSPKASGASIDLDQPAQESAIFLCLMKGVYQVCKRKEILNWLIATEASVHRNLQRNMIFLQPIGPEVDYFGPVRPYLVNIPAMEEQLLRKNIGYLKFMNEGLEENHRCSCLEANRVTPREFSSV